MQEAVKKWKFKPALKDGKPVAVSPRVLNEFEGYYALRLVECDGVPKYSNGGLYAGADETSTRNNLG